MVNNKILHTQLKIRKEIPEISGDWHKICYITAEEKNKI
jgi:hypothetical protein